MQYSKYKRDETVNMNDCRLKWFLLKFHSETQKFGMYVQIEDVGCNLAWI